MTGPGRSVVRIPPWRDVRVLGFAAQVLTLLAVVAVGAVLLHNLLAGMAASGLSFLPGFLGTTAGFDIGASPLPYVSTDSYGWALLVGLANTLLVSVLGIVLATVLGLVVGVARLSNNWLVARLSAGYVEIFRNTPLLVQLFFLYFAVLLQLPMVRDSIMVGDVAFLNRRGISLPRPLVAEPAWIVGGVAAGIAVAWLCRRSARRRSAEGSSGRTWRVLGWFALVVVPVGAWLAAPQTPVVMEVPAFGTFNIRGGLTLSPEFTALLLGLVLYTAAFIAEIVRGGIQAVPRGQSEAGRALGLPEGDLLRLVVLPQALRIIVPPLTSQYLNLIKNSSLAIAIGFQDLFNVSNTMMNQTGQPVATIGLVMVIYLALSLITSAVMAVVNRRVQVRER